MKPRFSPSQQSARHKPSVTDFYQHDLYAAQEDRKKVFITLFLVIALSALMLLAIIWRAGYVLLQQNVFPKNTIVNGENIGGLSFEEGFETIKLRNQHALQDLNVQIIYSGQLVSFQADDFNTEQTLRNILLEISNQGNPKKIADCIYAITSPIEGQTIDLHVLFDEEEIEQLLLSALSGNSSVAGGNVNKSTPLLHTELNIISPTEKALHLSVDQKTLIEYISGMHAPQKYDTSKPVPHQDIIQKYSDIYALDPAYVAANIFSLSRFDANFQSSSGGIGLLQITPAKGQWIAAQLKLSDYTTEMLYDPTTNIQMGCYYLSYVRKLFEYDSSCTLSSMAVGHEVVQDWLQDKAYSQNGKTLSSIPDLSARQNVYRVPRYTKIYRLVFVR